MEWDPSTGEARLMPGVSAQDMPCNVENAVRGLISISDSLSTGRVNMKRPSGRGAELMGLSIISC